MQYEHQPVTGITVVSQAGHRTPGGADGSTVTSAKAATAMLAVKAGAIEAGDAPARAWALVGLAEGAARSGDGARDAASRAT
jgi:hypothetical protein